MAVVDSLLKLLAAQGADALVVPSGEPPSLLRAGEPRPLSMPDPGPEFVAAVVHDVTDEAARARLSAGEAVEGTYVAGDGTRYAVRVEPSARGPRVVLRTGNAPVPTAPVPTAPVSTAPVPTAPVSSPLTPPPSTAREVAIETAAPAVVDPGSLLPILQRASYERASDVIFSSGMNTRLRVGGHIVEMPHSATDDATLLRFIDPALGERAREELQRTGSADVAIEVHEGGERSRFRANLFRQRGGLALALRPVLRRAPTLAELNLPAELGSLAQLGSGLVLMTGTAGSGKSTTLVALIEHVNQTAAKHVITLEDPIEYEYAPQRSLVHQREVGTHVDAFSTGLRAALRETPDVILLGEMRDHDTIAAALTAAETGHLVLSTLHASGVAMAIDRMLDVFPAHQQAQVRHQVASVLRAIITQRLVPSTRPPMRVPAIELLRVNTAVAAKIRESRGHQMQSEVQKGRGEGMIPLEASLAELVRRGLVSVETAVDAADEPALLQQMLKAR
jgi:twitching motility protein PilT